MLDTTTRTPRRERDQTTTAADTTERLYRAHMPAAVRLATLLCTDRALAEDVAQEAFLAAASRLFALRSPDRFGAYLNKAVVRRVLSSHRSEARDRVRAERHGAVTQSPDLVADAATRLDLAAVVGRLPARQRVAIVLRYWRDLSDRQIATATGWPVGTVKSTLARALDTLRKDLDDQA